VCFRLLPVITCRGRSPWPCRRFVATGRWLDGPDSRKTTFSYSVCGGDGAVVSENPAKEGLQYDSGPDRCAILWPVMKLRTMQKFADPFGHRAAAWEALRQRKSLAASLRPPYRGCRCRGTFRRRWNSASLAHLLQRLRRPTSPSSDRRQPDAFRGGQRFVRLRLKKNDLGRRGHGGLWSQRRVPAKAPKESALEEAPGICGALDPLVQRAPPLDEKMDRQPKSHVAQAP
jgi:hypothetical protein